MTNVRRRMSIVLVAALLVLGLAGCSDDSPTGGETQTTAAGEPRITNETTPEPLPAVSLPADGPVTSEPRPGGTVETPDPGPSEPTPVSPSPGTIDPRRTAVDHIVSAPDSDELEVWFWNGAAPCALLDRVEVDETPTQVTVVVYVGAGTTDQACIDLAQRYSTTVELDAPLGNREVIDGGTR